VSGRGRFTLSPGCLWKFPGPCQCRARGWVRSECKYPKKRNSFLVARRITALNLIKTVSHLYEDVCISFSTRFNVWKRLCKNIVIIWTRETVWPKGAAFVALAKSRRSLISPLSVWTLARTRNRSVASSPCQDERTGRAFGRKRQTVLQMRRMQPLQPWLRGGSAMHPASPASDCLHLKPLARVCRRLGAPSGPAQDLSLVVIDDCA
jgi:hypothetical protein